MSQRGSTAYRVAVSITESGLPPHDRRPIVIASNRGPVTFRVADGAPVAGRGGGGLVAGLGSLGRTDEPVSWLAVAMSDGDRLVARAGPVEAEGFSVHLLELDDEQHRLAYDVISNGTLWFLHHGLFDPTRTPSFDADWRAAWAAYRAVNQRFADRLSTLAPDGATVLVQDYHLSLVGAMLRSTRPDLRTVHFHHTPFAGVDELAMVPIVERHELLAGLCGFDACGFHTDVWAARFTACVAADPSLAIPDVFAAPLNVHAAALRERAAADDVEVAVERLRSAIGDRRFMVRVDRIELSKNLLRGFEAYEELLEAHPEHRGAVIFGAFCYPSREGVPEYARYRREAEAMVNRINDAFGTADWTPVLWETHDDYPRSLAALRLAEVLIVNPIRDGLNLVAKEGPLVNDRSVRLVLSEHAGSVRTLGDWAQVINPFDVSATADAMHDALTLSADQRSAHFERLVAAIETTTPEDWLRAQIGR